MKRIDKNPHYPDRSWIDELTHEEYAYYFPDPSAGEIPTVYGIPFQVPYSTRGPDEFVISGPLGYRCSGISTAIGRPFGTVEEARTWARGRYKSTRDIDGYYPSQELIDAGLAAWPPRWAFLVRRM